MRFASRENTLVGQPEVGLSVVPGGGPMARLSRLVGRGRALEILLVADDLDGPRAAQYGYVNRVIADDRLDDEVNAIAERLARFDHDALARTKSYVDRVTLPPDGEFPSALADFFEMLGRPEQRVQNARLEALGLNTTVTSSGRSAGAWSSRLPRPDSGGRHDSKVASGQVARGNPHDVEPVAVLDVDHLTRCRDDSVNDSVQKHLVREIYTRLIHLGATGARYRAGIRCVEGVGAIEHGIAEGQFHLPLHGAQPQSDAVPEGGVRMLGRS